VAPKILPFSFGDNAHSFGQSIQISCVVIEGDAPFQFQWSFEGSEPTTVKQEGVTTMKVGERSSVLFIENIEHNHSGKYSCTVKNRVGNSTFAANLVVKGIFMTEEFLHLACLLPQLVFLDSLFLHTRP